MRIRINKKAYYFSLDALLAIILILGVILFMHPFAKMKSPEMKVQDDIMRTLSSLKIGEYALAASPGAVWANTSINNGIINDTNISILEQLSRFYAFSDEQNLHTLADNIFSDIGYTNNNIGLFFDNYQIYPNSQNLVPTINFTNSSFIWTARQAMTGIQKGNGTKGYSSRALLNSVLNSKYFYFGGYVGQKNVSAVLSYDGKINQSIVEAAFSTNFSLYVNNQYIGFFNASPSTEVPVRYNIPTTYFEPNKNNTIKFVGDLSQPNTTFYIAGGYIKILYESNKSYSSTKKFPLPGIEGVINLYDSFYVPGDLQSMEIFLHYKNNFTNFFVIGNTTIFNETSPVETTRLITNSEIQTKLSQNNQNYNSLSNKTIPLRYGLQQYSATQTKGVSDAVLVTDVSGSMEWCNSQSEAQTATFCWDDAQGQGYCGSRWVTKLNQPKCGTQKIDVLKDATKDFTDIILNNSDSRVGMVDFTSPNTTATYYRRVFPAVAGSSTNGYSYIAPSFYVGSSTDCYLPDWFKENFDDSSWLPYTSGTNVLTGGTETYSAETIYLRKKFIVYGYSKIKVLNFSESTNKLMTCFVNGNAFYEDDGSGPVSMTFPKTILREGENTLACTIKTQKGTNWNFAVQLSSEQGIFVSKTDSFVYTKKSNCYTNQEWLYCYNRPPCNTNNLFNPAGVRVLNNTLTNFTLYTTVYNIGSASSSQFNISFYNCTIDNNCNIASSSDCTANGGAEIGRVSISGIGAFGTVTASMNYTATFNNTRYFSTCVSPENNFAFTSHDKSARISSRTASIYSLGKDIRFNDLIYTNPQDACSFGTKTFNLRATLTNPGDIAITETFYVDFYHDSKSPANKIASVAVNGLTAGATAYATTSYSTNFQSSIPILAYVDDANIVAEVDENNNNGAMTISKQKPDLQIYNPYYHDAQYGIKQTQSVCTTGTTNVNVDVIVHNVGYCTAQASSVSLSLDPADKSVFKTVPALNYNQIYTNKFTMPITINQIDGTPYYWYASVDKDNVVDEMSESNSGTSNPFIAGTNLYSDFKKGLTVTPTSVNVLTPVTFNINLDVLRANADCPINSYNVKFYRDSITSGNLINTTRVVPSFNLLTKANTTWTTTLTANTIIYAVIDGDSEIIEYNKTDNVYSALINVGTLASGQSVELNKTKKDMVYFSLFPILDKLKLKPFLLIQNYNGLDTAGCQSFLYSNPGANPVGIPTPLFSSPPTTESSIARKLSLTNDKTTLQNYIRDTDTWWGTCTCCGILSATAMLSTQSTSNGKAMVVVSDGAPTIRCNNAQTDYNGDGSVNEKDDAIKAACDAYNLAGITVHAISIGEASDRDDATLHNISECGKGNFTIANSSNLKEALKKYALQIVEASYTSQKISTPDWLNTTLYPDSYISLNYTFPSTDYGVAITAETPAFGNNLTLGNLELPPRAKFLEANIISYSGERWTDKVFFRNSPTQPWNNSIFDLESYGKDYTKVGDPYAINIPRKLLVAGNNSINISAASNYNDSDRTGSSYDKIIFTILAEMSYYSPIKAQAKGCNWTIQFKGDETPTYSIKIPSNYNGAFNCVYDVDTKRIVNPNDAVAIGTFYLLQKLDFDNDGKVDVKFINSNLQIDTNDVFGIPFTWATDAQVKVWR